MDRENIYKKVKAEVELLASKNVSDGDMEIFKDGFLDSLNIMHIIMYMESEFDFKINPYDLTIDMLSTLNKITAFIIKKI